MGDKPIRVLVVDDDRDDYLLTRDLFGEMNGQHYVVDWAADYDSALEAICSNQYDVYLLDYQLGARNGLELLREAKAKNCTGAAIILTGHGQHELDLEAMQAGAADYLEKGVLHAALLERSVRYALDQKRHQDELEQRVAERTAELARTNEALRDSEERYRGLFDAVPVAVFVCDSSGVIQDYNQRAAQLWHRQPQRGDPRERYCGAVRLFLPDGTPLPNDHSPIVDVLRTGTPQHDVELAIERPDGSIIPIVAHFSALKSAKGDIRGAIASFDDVTPQKRAQQALEEADRQKDEFLATLAHELRNPLGTIRHLLYLIGLRRGEISNAERQEYAIIQRQSNTLVRLVDDLLDVSRITRGMIQLKRERVELARIVTHAVESSRPLIDAQRHTLEIKAPEEALWVDGDPVRLGQILINLLNNAAKYTPPGGQIRLSVERSSAQPPEAIIRVRDSGMGIPANMLTRVFDLFTQGARAPEQAAGGLGIGLTLVRRLVEMHGGSVQATSAGPEQGSEFVVRLPLSIWGAPIPQSGPPPLRKGGPGTEPQVVAADDVKSDAHRILVVDDNLDSAESLAALLRLLGNDVRTAHDGPRALAVAEAYRPDMVLLDIGLPGMDGLEVCRRLRQLERVSPVLVVAMTGYGQEENKRQSLAAGFDAHLVKPLDLDALRELLARLT